MNGHPIKPHLTPQEIARRQRWATVGIAVLAMLLIATWLVGLPNRVASAVYGSTWHGMAADAPEAKLIDIDAVLNTDEQKAQVTNTIDTMSAAENSSSTPATTRPSPTVTTSTVNLLKQKLK